MAALVQAGLPVGVVVAPSAESPALGRAKALGVRTEIVPYAPSETYGERLLRAFSETEIMCLAGFMRLLPADFLARYPGTVLNIHPALLPKFGGQGMYGHHVHEAVLAAGETETGCSVHRVTPVYDEGEVIVQRSCPVLSDDTPETLAARVLALEHEAYAEAVRSLLA